MSRRDDEKTKLLAGLLNTSAGACVTTGIITPIVAVFFNFGNSAGDVTFWKLPVSGVGFAVAAIVLHAVARRVLNRLEE
jgi:membrane protein implicated in regulation of membrane protease activity